jgi:hypothetical protein
MTNMYEKMKKKEKSPMITEEKYPKDASLLLLSTLNRDNA